MEKVVVMTMIVMMMMTMTMNKKKGRRMSRLDRERWRKANGAAIDLVARLDKCSPIDLCCKYIYYRLCKETLFSKATRTPWPSSCWTRDWRQGTWLSVVPSQASYGGTCTATLCTMVTAQTLGSRYATRLSAGLLHA